MATKNEGNARYRRRSQRHPTRATTGTSGRCNCNFLLRRSWTDERTTWTKPFLITTIESTNYTYAGSGAERLPPPLPKIRQVWAAARLTANRKWIAAVAMVLFWI